MLRSLVRRIASAASRLGGSRAAVAVPVGYWLTRFVLLRLLGFIYFIAFLVAIRQLVPLIGRRGLLPADLYLRRLTDHFGSRTDGFLNLPTVFWLGISDRGLLAVAWSGAALSLLVMLGYANAIIMLILWMLYTSIVNVGQLWYGYGWETQLLETGFLSVFLCPLLDGRPFPRRAPPVVVLWLFRWLIFRIMLGAGLIKLRGDPCWRDLTCLYYHYETQPIPNPLSWWLHFRPHWFHKFGVLWNDFIELVVPWFGFWPRPARHVAGVLMASFQGMNTSFNRLNLVNTYGAFGSVGRERFEIVFEGTDSESPDFAVWREYEFVAKPGDPWRRPPIIAPYQPRIDWQIWFAAMATPQQYPWTIHFVWKLLHNDAGTLSLLANNPFPNAPPRFIRAQLYRYRFIRPGELSGPWWHREPVEMWLPPLSSDNAELQRILERLGWL